ncbi:MAG: Undecaprenyl-diphosphatase [Deltaproteobacteria bacterium ADurb.Bin510]|nr:MAG: Undecaprenyl-diphosphatase [Deltaproteobacteria bacterium ADurb.Bin510]
MLAGLAGRDEQGRSLLVNTLVAFAPAVVIGLLCEDMIKRYLFGLKPIVAAWLIGGLAILIVARRLKAKGERGRPLEDLTARSALIIGLIQCVAMWPGVSRSLVTILGGALVGLSVPAAVEFSFILGLVTLGGATCYELLKEGPAIYQMFGFVSPAFGIVVAFVSAVIAVKWMVAYLNRHGLEVFGYYRIVLGLAVGGLMLGGLLA